MRKRPLRFAASVAAASLLAAACGGDAENDPASGELTKVSIVLGFTASPEYSPAFVALEKGYFREEGYDVEIVQGGNVEPTVLVATGQNDYLFGSMDDVPLAAQEGLGLRAVAANRQVNAFGIMTAPDSGISTPKDLEGKQVALPSAGASRLLWSPFVSLNGVDESKVEIVSVSGRATVTALLSGDVDAASGASYTNLVRVREDMPDAGWLAYADYGVGTIGSGLVTTESKIEESPDEVRGIVRAFLRGLNDSLTEHQFAVDSVEKYFPEGISAYQDPIQVITTVNEMVGKPLGQMSDEVWQATVDVLVQAGDLESPQPLDVYYTNEFIEPVD